MGSSHAQEQRPLLSGRSATLSPSERQAHLPSFETGFPRIVDEQELHQLQPPSRRKSSAASPSSSPLWSLLWTNGSVAFTLLMSAIGAGTLAVPYTFLLLPPAQAVIALYLVGAAMAFTADCILRVHVAVVSGASPGHTEVSAVRETYQELAVYAGGVRLARVVGGLTAFAVFGACVGCVRVVRDMAPMLVSLVYLHSNAPSASFDQLAPSEQQQLVTWTVWLVFLLVVLPLSMVKKISALRYSSYLGFAFSIYLVGAVAYRAARSIQPSANELLSPTLSPTPPPADTIAVTTTSGFMRLSEAIGIYNFTFMMHLNVIPLLAQLVVHTRGDASASSSAKGLRRAERRMRYNVYLAVLVCVLLYAVFGLCAVSIYGSATQGNILLNLAHDPIMVVPRVAILCTILFSFPLLFHPLRSLVLEMRCCGDQPSLWTHTLVSVALLVAQLLCATRVPGIQVVFSFVGSSILLLLCYVLPAVYYARLVPWRGDRAATLRLRALQVVAAIATVFCTSATVQLVFPG